MAALALIVGSQQGAKVLRSLFLRIIEYKFYSGGYGQPRPDRLALQATGPAARPTDSGLLTAEQEAAAVAELMRAGGWAALLIECAGLVLGYGEHQVDAARYRQIAELCVAAGVDQTLIEAWIEVGHQRAGTATALTHKACVLWDS
jgi:hypothetical protein